MDTRKRIKSVYMNVGVSNNNNNNKEKLFSKHFKHLFLELIKVKRLRYSNKRCHILIFFRNTYLIYSDVEKAGPSKIHRMSKIIFKRDKVNPVLY